MTKKEGDGGKPLGSDKGSRETSKEHIDLYGAIFESNHAVALLIATRSGRIVDASPGACTFYGYEHQVLAGMTIFEIDTLPEETVRKTVKQATTGKKYRFGFRHRLADGSIHDVEAICTPVTADNQTYICCIIHDITEQKLAEEETKGSEQLLKAILSASPIGICRIENQAFRWANETFCRLTRYSPKEISGKHPRFLFDKDKEWDRVNHMLEASGWCETQLKARDSSLLDVLVQSSSADNTSTIMTVTDITHRHQAEREQTQVGKLESLGVLAGGIAHDFNNILTMILGNVSLARMYLDKDQAKATEKLMNAEQAIMRAKDLTQQLLTFSKGGTPIKKVVQIGLFLTDVCQFALTGTPVICKFDFSHDLLPVEIDEGQMTQVLGHIVINAYQAMPDGGVITVKAQNTLIDHPSDHLCAGRYVKISVTDEGVGISEEYLSKIFDPYFSTKQKGSGLGLAISYSIIKHHKGHLSVESKLGIGTTFHIYLPVFEGAASAQTEVDLTLPVKGKKVLVMDDEDSIRDMVGDILDFHGYEVDFATNGEEALSLYEDNRYDVVILDLTIPGGMGGKETIRQLLKIDPNVKAIVSSGYSSDPIMSNYRQYGFRDVIAKPYHIEELGKVMHRVVREP